MTQRPAGTTLVPVSTVATSALRPYLWTLGVLWLLPGVLVALGWLVLPKDLPPGQCEGIGFGCTLSPADTVLLLGLMAAPALLAAGVIGVLLVATVQAVRSARAKSVDTSR
jgi:hypothetical protein